MLRGHLRGRLRKRETKCAYHGALQNTTAHWNGYREFSTDAYTRDQPRQVCIDPQHDDITKTELLHFQQKKAVVDGVKGLGKIKVGNTNRVAFVHHTRHRYLEDQQIGETGPAG